MKEWVVQVYFSMDAEVEHTIETAARDYEAIAYDTGFDGEREICCLFDSQDNANGFANICEQFAEVRKVQLE